MCTRMVPTLPNPYLRIIFKFLNCKSAADSDYEPIFAETEALLCDRAACALMYLDDTRLRSLFVRLTAQAIEEGDLEGLLLTGIGSAESINLLQRYVAHHRVGIENVPAV